MKKIVLLVLALALVFPAAAFAETVDEWQDSFIRDTQEVVVGQWYGPYVSQDLTAQAACASVKAQIKVHPALEVGIANRTTQYLCLNPATNKSATLKFLLGIKSNLPWFKTIKMSAFEYTPGPTTLQSYRYVDGEWKLVPWDITNDGPLPGYSRPGGVPDVLFRCGGMGVLSSRVRGAEILCDDPSTPENEAGQLAWTGWVDEVADADGIIGPIGLGDIDHHLWEEEVTWKSPDIDWCVTAGYYEANMSVCVYQN